MFGDPQAGPPRVIALLVLLAVAVGIGLGVWLFGAMT